MKIEFKPLLATLIVLQIIFWVFSSGGGWIFSELDNPVSVIVGLFMLVTTYGWVQHSFFPDTI